MYSTHLDYRLNMIHKLALRNNSLAIWSIRNRLLDCLEMIQRINFTISHIFRKENQCIDKLLI